jgi:hypothetical protein
MREVITLALPTLLVTGLLILPHAGGQRQGLHASLSGFARVWQARQQQRNAPDRYASELESRVLNATGGSFAIFSNGSETSERSVAANAPADQRVLSGDELKRAKALVLSASSYRTQVTEKTACTFWPDVGLTFRSKAGDVWWLVSLPCGEAILVKVEELWDNAHDRYLRDSAIKRLQQVRSGRPF